MRLTVFQGDTDFELLEQITEFDPKPLRQWDDSIAPELERICFKMLAKRKSERYSSATDLADDLKVLLSKSPANYQSPDPRRSEEHNQTLTPSSSQTPAANDLLRHSSAAAPPAPTPTSRGEALKIVPKGLRSLNHRDADFFLELLPGARDRDGLPESIAFWKSRIEERDADQTFSVGLVYGPSGCGKSSMMKAGLLPKLSADVMSIYLEATSDDTERTLLSTMGKKLDAVKSESMTRLVDVLQEIRRGRILPRGKKLLIVIDQFEQWLFSHPQTVGEPLLDALLQCDGARVQAIVMVRDDFWMAATRFFHDLDIPLLERVNSAAVDLFDLNHAQRVLRAFGNAFGKLESREKQDKQAQNQFMADAAKATDVERLGTANAFADYAKTDIEKLSRLLAVATPEQFAVLYPIVAIAPASSTVDDLRRITATLPADEVGSAERIVFGQRRANAAVTLLRLGARDQVLPVFEMIDDPEALTQFIFRCRSRGVRVDELLELLELVTQRVNLKPNSTRQSLAGAAGFDRSYAHYAVLLAMGEYTLDEVPQPRRESLLKELADTYRNDSSSGVHGAAGWLLRKWGQVEVVREVDQTAVPYSTDREWFTLSITVMPTVMPTPASEAITEPVIPKNFYYTFCVFPAGDYLIGSVPDEADREKKDESRHEVKLTRPFALLNREVTMAELIAFFPKDWMHHVQSDVQPEISGFSVNWYDAVAYCRWLSLQSGMEEVDQAYADPAKLDKEQYPRELNLRDNWAPRNWQLQQTQRGFRLMTEAEWEVASRAGCRTTFAYGSEAGLMDRFGWFTANCGNHVHPPRELRPSLKGLFDIHGNVAEWTHDWFLRTEGKTVDPVGANNGSYRVIRGGGWRHIPTYCRSSSRSRYDPTNTNDYFGIRLALSLAVEEH